MLGVDEQGTAIGCHRDARDFITRHSSQQATQFAGLCVRYQKLVVEAVFLATIGFDEQAAIRISPDSVR